MEKGFHIHVQVHVQVLVTVAAFTHSNLWLGMCIDADYMYTRGALIVFIV